MEHRLFIYTRLTYQDYHKVYSPEKGFMPNEIEARFTGFAREVINEDRISNGSIEKPRWSFYKIGDFLLYGIGCRNKLLSENHSDSSGRAIRGFFGFIVKSTKGETIRIFDNIDSFRALYAAKVSSLFFSSSDSEVSNISSEWQSPIEGAPLVINDDRININTSDSQTAVLKDSSRLHSVAAEIAYCETETNMVFHLNNKSHIMRSQLTHFYNVSIIDNESEFLLQKTAEKENHNNDNKKETSKSSSNCEIGTDESHECGKQTGQQNMLIDVYADFCIEIGEACKSIGNKVAKHGHKLKKNQNCSRQMKHNDKERPFSPHKARTTEARQTGPNPQINQDWLEKWQNGDKE